MLSLFFCEREETLWYSRKFSWFIARQSIFSKNTDIGDLRPAGLLLHKMNQASFGWLAPSPMCSGKGGRKCFHAIMR